LYYNVTWAKEARATDKAMLRLAQLQLVHSTEKYQVDIQKHRLFTSSKI